MHPPQAGAPLISQVELERHVPRRDHSDDTDGLPPDPDPDRTPHHALRRLWPVHRLEEIDVSQQVLDGGVDPQRLQDGMPASARTRVLISSTRSRSATGALMLVSPLRVHEIDQCPR